MKRRNRFASIILIMALVAGGASAHNLSQRKTASCTEAFNQPEERGFYLHPEAFNQPQEKGVLMVQHLDLLRQMKESGLKQS